MSEFKPGSMDIREHEKTFAGLITWAKRVVILTILALVFMALANS